MRSLARNVDVKIGGGVDWRLLRSVKCLVGVVKLDVWFTLAVSGLSARGYGEVDLEEAL